MPESDNAPLTVCFPIAKDAVGWGGKRSLTDLCPCLRLRASRRGGTVSITADEAAEMAVRMDITGRVGMRDHTERAEKRVQQGHKGGLRAGRYEVVDWTVAQ